MLNKQLDLLQTMNANLTQLVYTSRMNMDVERPLENWTNVTLHSVSELEETDSSAEIVRMMQVIARPPIIVLGTIGNLLAFLVMQRGSLRKMSTCFYMSILGLADTGEFHLCCMFTSRLGIRVFLFQHKSNISVQY